MDQRHGYNKDGSPISKLITCWASDNVLWKFWGPRLACAKNSKCAHSMQLDYRKL
uniref:Uncharacterized protein n=1 Tax=Arion vulgaris TaxID=1028688 RepID=A0A0B7AYH5_9EUPU